MIPDSVWNEYQYCSTNKNSPSCEYAEEQIENLTEDLNIYNVFLPCLPDPIIPNMSNYENIIPCAASQGAVNYFNNEEVKAALGVNQEIIWTPCSDSVYNKYQMLGSTYQLFKSFKSSGVRVLVYSGDIDSKVPTINTLAWIGLLGWPIVSPWTPWFASGNQIAGFYQVYPGLTFATVKGAGHMVPQWKRPEAYYMFVNYLFNTGPFLPRDNFEFEEFAAADLEETETETVVETMINI
jgi:carboxypeptidase C (cathepsin A)